MPGSGELPTLEYRLRFISDFHIGSGLGYGQIDDVTARDDYGVVYIPGSTIRGIARDGAERVAQALKEAGLITTSVIDAIFEGDALGPRWHFSDAVMPPGLEALRGPSSHLGPQARRELAEALDESELVFTSRVAIDPRTGRSAEKQLFFYEDGSGALEFCGFVRRLRPDDGPGLDMEMTLLRAGFLWVRSLGLGRRRGAGECRFVLQEDGFDLEAALRRAMEATQ